MKQATLGFIGGGRVVRIILEGLRRSGRGLADVTVSDSDAAVLDRLREPFPDIGLSSGDNGPPAGCDIVFLALHPPAIPAVLEEIKDRLKPEAVLISLAPKITSARISTLLGGFGRIARLIPNAPSIINRGFNPVAFAPALGENERMELKELLGQLGDCLEVPEEQLEAYAVIAAMGPTYFWFQWLELAALGESFGLSGAEAGRAVSSMVAGAVRTLFDSGLDPSAILDLVPVRPLEENETEIRNMYRARLEPLYRKIKP